MNLVSNTKTLIFDDKYEEIIYLRNALDMLKVQNLYIKFDEPCSINEEDKFTNVRFVFADILYGASRIGTKSDITGIISSISEHLSKKNGAFVLILWSNTSEELADELIHELRSVEGYNFFPIKTISKAKYAKKLDDELEQKNLINELILELKKELQENTEYFNLLRLWERDVHTAASETFNILLDDLTNKEKTRSLLKNAIIASAGKKQITNEISKRKNLWNTLNMVLNDNVEAQLPFLKIKSDIAKILNELDDASSVSTNELINKKLLFSKTSNTDLKMHPGNVFSFDSYVSACTHLKQKVCGYKNNEVLVDEVLDDVTFNEYINKYKTQKGLNKKDTTAFRKSEKSTFIPILLEFTPYCDFSQKGYKKSRLIYGHVVPIHLRDYILSNSKFVYKTPNFEFEDNVNFIQAGKYFLVLNIKHIFSVNPEFLNQFDLLFRARKELVNDIQHEIANHVSRVGVTSL